MGIKEQVIVVLTCISLTANDAKYLFMGLLTFYIIFDEMASLVTQTVKNLPAMWETWVQSLG